MQGNLRLGHVAGIDVRLDWSWLLVGLLFFVSLSAHFFASHPLWSLGLSVLLAFLAVIGIAASIIAHELVQAVVARRLGTPVTAITLFLLGGIATYPREGRTPAREIVVAFVGPVTSLVLGFVLITLAGLLQVPLAKLWVDASGVLAWLEPVPALLAWVGIANLAIALFNAIPAFPLDGGRVLRALLWALDGDYRTATRVAARIGQAISLVMIAIGIASAFRLGPLAFTSGIWVAFLGWFLLSAASTYHQSALLEERLGGLVASHLMHPVTSAIGPDVPIASAVANHFVGTSARALPVMEHGACVGLLRFEDVRRVPAREWEARPVRDAMIAVAELPRIGARTDLAETLRTMLRAEIATLPVLEGDDVIGVLEMQDIVRWIEFPEPEPRIAPA
ncbi:site-2 protease family protein [Sandaracinus amylolyticus]|nr:site-2 protease family protein [Sandaracinus amylolyticus]